MVAVKEILDFPSGQKPKVPSRLLYKNSSTPNSFQDAMKVPLILLQIFGFFPLKGITGLNYRNLKFSWISWRCCYCILALFGYTFHFVCFCCHQKINKVLAMNAVFFQMESILLSILFIYLAKQWPEFVKEWHLVEVSMKSYELSINLKRKIAIIIASILSLALIEHSMVTAMPIIISLRDNPNNQYAAASGYFTQHAFIEIFRYVPFHLWLGMIFQVLNLQKTFIWTFVDVFIIVVSICLNFRFQQMSKKLCYMSKSEVSHESIWRTIREDYVKLTRLCELTNKRICWFIIISYVANMYHILSQLFSSLRPMENNFHKIYFYVSFFLLILRVTTVCIFGGAVYDEHEHITRILTTVPSAAYNIEVTSAIVTYELVLIQFNQKEFETKEL